MFYLIQEYLNCGANKEVSFSVNAKSGRTNTTDSDTVSEYVDICILKKI